MADSSRYELEQIPNAAKTTLQAGLITAPVKNTTDGSVSFAYILKTYPAIHGVVHSALVLHDQSIARMDESGFRAGLSAKVDVSVNLDRVFGNEELDFMLLPYPLVNRASNLKMLGSGLDWAASG